MTSNILWGNCDLSAEIKGEIQRRRRSINGEIARASISSARRWLKKTRQKGTEGTGNDCGRTPKWRAHAIRADTILDDQITALPTLQTKRRAGYDGIPGPCSFFPKAFSSSFFLARNLAGWWFTISAEFSIRQIRAIPKLAIFVRKQPFWNLPEGLANSRIAEGAPKVKV